MRVLGALAAAMLFAGSAQAVVILNGSFETGTNPPATGFNQLGAGSADITGWTIGGGGVDWIGDYWQPSNGSRSLDMTAINAGSVSQDIATIVNQRYIVTFDLAGNPDANGGPAVKNLDVTINGGDLANYTFDTSGTSRSNMGWLGQTYSFVATSTTSTLAFTSNTGLASGPALDNVAISAVPEAATWVMLVAGFGMVGMSTRRRRSVVAA